MIKYLIKITQSPRQIITTYLGIIFVAATLYSLFEAKSFWDSFWWAIVTALTIGYGDNYPVTFGGRLVAITLMHVIVLLVIPLITGRISAKLIVDSNVFTNEEQEQIKNDLREIKHMLNKSHP